MSNATFITADQNWQDETTIYWFDMDGEMYGMVEGEGAGAVDCDGCPIDYNDALRAEVERNCIVTDEIRAGARGGF